MIIKNSQFRVIALFVVLFVVLISLFILDSVWADQPEIRAKTVKLISESNKDVNSLFLNSRIASLNTSVSKTTTIYPEIKTDFKFNGLGLKWKLYNNIYQDKVDFYVKVENSNWIKVSAMEDSGKSVENNYIAGDPIFVDGEKVEIKLIGNVGLIKDLEVVYFDSTKSYSSPVKSLTSITSNNSSQQSSNLNIISREQWGADEDYRFWEPSYQDPQAFVIHHTAGSDGGDDVESTIRGIYYWHAVVLGWGDIGYNYLVDKDGNIYEGRYGGDKVIGAHTYNSVDNVNYNEGTVGVAVLGCYEDDDSDCYSVDEYNKKIRAALRDLISHKAVDLNIDLEGKRYLFSELASSIVAHKRLDYTLCPGNLIQEKLSKLRELAKAKYKTLVDAKEYKASLVEQNFATAYYLNSENDITVTYKNTGDLTLKAEKTYVKVYNQKTKEKQKIYLDQDLAVGQSASFNFSWLANKVGKQDIIVRLYRNKKYIKGSKQIVKLRVDNPNKAKLKKSNLPTAVLASWNPTVNFKYKNVGVVAWNNEDTGLYINSQRVAYLNQKSVAPRKTGNFIFNLQILKKLKKGNNKLIIKLKTGDQTIANSRLIELLRVD